MNKYWSDLLNDLEPYVAGEQPQDRSYVKLNTNENPYPPGPAVLEAIQEATARLRLYPDPDARSLTKAIAEFYSLGEEQVFVGNGSDEVLGLAFLAFFRNKPPVSFPDITYSFYPVYCRLFGIPYRVFPLTDRFEIDDSLIPAEAGAIVIANPNASTGACLTRAAIEGMLERHPHTLVLVDEAYIDFGGETCATLIGDYPNLLVVQTVSKSRSLAGLRVGLALGDAALIDALGRVKNSFNAYPLDALAIAGATASFRDRDSFDRNRRLVQETREWTTAELQKLSFYVVPSKANFLMISHKVKKAEDLYRELKQKGILVRWFKQPRIDNFLRVSIGTPEDMRAFVLALSGLVR